VRRLSVSLELCRGEMAQKANATTLYVENFAGTFIAIDPPVMNRAK
jgi:hypothetical protein